MEDCSCACKGKTMEIPVPPMSKKTHLRAPKMSKFNIWGRPPCSKKRNQTQSITINCTEQVRKRPLAKVAYLWQPAHPELCHATPCHAMPRHAAACRAWCMLRIFRAAAATSQDWRWSSTWGFGTSPSRGSYCRDMSGSYTANQFLLLRSSAVFDWLYWSVLILCATESWLCWLLGQLCIELSYLSWAAFFGHAAASYEFCQIRTCWFRSGLLTIVPSARPKGWTF